MKLNLKFPISSPAYFGGQWDNHTDAAGIVHFRALLQDEMQLLQFRLRCFLARNV